MRTTILLLLLLAGVMPSAKADSITRIFDLLPGKWVAKTDNGHFIESWTREDDFHLKGTGILVENGDTASGETLELLRVGSKVVYIGSPAGQAPVLFTLSTDGREGAYQFVNAEHDFPQVIEYTFRGDDTIGVIVGTLAGEGFELELVRETGDRAVLAGTAPAKEETHEPLLKNDAVVLGVLMLVLGFVFYTSSSSNPFWKKFYTYVPALLLCYFIPGILNSLGLISGEHSNLYFVASRYLLPASLLLLCIGIDFKGIAQLGPKAVIMFLAGMAGVIIGGPIALMAGSLMEPELLKDLGAESSYRGLATIAGSWIGGGANQAAMKEVFKPSDGLFSIMVAVDVLVANLWMAVLLLGAGNRDKVDRWLRADNSAINTLQKKLTDYQETRMRIPKLPDTMVIAAVAFAGVGLSHLIADYLSPWLEANAPALAKFSLTSSFFWIVVISTTIGLLLSLTRARNLEHAGASRLGSVFLYVLVATIGMEMDITAVVGKPVYFVVGLVWIAIHGAILIFTARLIKAPLFFAAVGSQANIGGAASAPVVASAFHPSLAPVGVLLAVLGYALGTYGAWICGIIMQSLI